MVQRSSQIADDQWVVFPGGELEGKRPKALCPQCRQALRGVATGQRLPHPVLKTREHRRTIAPLCFQCYRAGLNRDKALQAAGQLMAASGERFQSALPFEPVNLPRLEMLKAERVRERAAMHEGVGRFVDRRRQAQIAARHALQRIAAGVAMRQIEPAERDRAVASVFHAAELQLPEAWLPFVVSR
jgi:hypothetical protein